MSKKQQSPDLHVVIKDGKAIITNPVCVIYVNPDGHIGTAWFGVGPQEGPIKPGMIGYALAVAARAGAVVAACSAHQIGCEVAACLVEFDGESPDHFQVIQDDLGRSKS